MEFINVLLQKDSPFLNTATVVLPLGSLLLMAIATYRSKMQIKLSNALLDLQMPDLSINAQISRAKIQPSNGSNQNLKLDLFIDSLNATPISISRAKFTFDYFSERFKNPTNMDVNNNECFTVFPNITHKHGVEWQCPSHINQIEVSIELQAKVANSEPRSFTLIKKVTI